MGFLYFLEKLRMPGLNEFFLAVTKLGEETAFLVIALIVFWCVDKRRGYFVMAVGFFGTLVSQCMKIVCRVPRPWVQDPNFTILEQAREAAAGYSFPSGHTQTAVGTLGAIAATEKRRWLSITCIVLAVFVGLSRMYIGVHTPQDVIVGGLLSVVFILVLYPFMIRNDGKGTSAVITVLTLASVAYMIFMECYPFPADTDTHNLESAMKNAYTLIGCMGGLLIVYPVERKFISFSTEAVWWAQILKIVGGLAVVLLVKEGLRSPLEAIFAGHLAARAVRYALIVLTAGLLWPLSFRFFAKLGKK
ncbi:MAG: phosphatase PAP2 family protein [Oscillospiraceae bacterium]|nr:phosphatase PAP2 family protein [Oscillospiraceae bacterium]